MKSPSAKERILVVDDSANTVEILQRNLTAEGYEIHTAREVSEAIKLLGNTEIDLIITDLKMPRVGGLDLVRYVRENLKDTEIMMITGYPSIEGAVEAVKTGAEEYLAKPFTDEELLSAVKRTAGKLRVRRSQRAPTGEPQAMLPGLIGDSKVMRQVYDAVHKAAATSGIVLITGESGTGKELVARAIHYGSTRLSAPFVPVNCGGIPEGLLESELFGHVKGAFTGATESRAGFFHAADGGTIFLDEIGETSASMQVKLLRVLQDREICMVGSNRTREVDVRILAAKNKNLSSLVKKGTFREDLFYRVNVIVVTVPPLRERGDDVLLLARHFADKFAAETGKRTPDFSEKVLQLFRNYYWPGNVREIENLVYHLVVMTEGDLVEVPDLPSHMRFSVSGGLGPHRTLAEVEHEHIRSVLAHVKGNKTQAAELLQIDRKTLRKKLKDMENSD